jgi:hypothetical protein
MSRTDLYIGLYGQLLVGRRIFDSFLSSTRLRRERKCVTTRFLRGIGMEPNFVYVEYRYEEDFCREGLPRGVRQSLAKCWIWMGSRPVEGAGSECRGNCRLLLVRQCNGLPSEWKKQLSLGREDLVEKIEFSDPYSSAAKQRRWGLAMQRELVRGGGRMFGRAAFESDPPRYCVTLHGDGEG